MKYIDAEKLIAEIERRIDRICTTEGIVQRDKLQEYETLRDVEDFITSLQQEQPEIKSYIEKLLKECVDNPGEYYRGRRETLAHLFYYLGGNPAEYLRFIKQPEVDLEKEIIKYKVPFTDEREYLNETTLDAIAYHFYELGLKARKED